MGLSFEAPAQWKVDDAEAETLRLVQLYGPWKRRLEHPKIAVFHYGPDSPYRSKERFVETRLKRRWKESDPDRELSGAKEIAVGNRIGQLWTVSYIGTFGLYSSNLHREPVKETYVLVDAPQGGFYVFQYKAAQAIYAAHYPAFESLLKSVRFP